MNITSVHQIEITSRCNLRCKYCPHPHMGRNKIDMDMSMYMKALSAARVYIERGTQRELNLAGIGESTLHPKFPEMVQMAYNVVKDTSCNLILATNGIEIVKNPELAKVLGRFNVHTWVSLHRPEKAGMAVELLKKEGVLYGVSADPSISAMDWAGQVDWFTSASTKGSPCPWLTEGRVVVLSDGSISTCCLDSEGVGVIGNIYDDLTKLEVKPYSLCDKCHHSYKEDKVVYYSGF